MKEDFEEDMKYVYYFYRTNKIAISNRKIEVGVPLTIYSHYSPEDDDSGVNGPFIYLGEL